MNKSALRYRVCSALLLAVIAGTASGASIVLREQATPGGSVVFLGDIADIAAASDEEMHNLATTPLMAAPAQGTQEFLHFARVLELLEGRGVDVSGLTIAGARTVEIGRSVSVQNPVAVEPVRQLTPADCEQAVAKAITAHLADITGHHDWQLELTLDAVELRDLCRLGPDMTASAGKSPWIGAQKFQIVGPNKGEPMFVFARVSRLKSVVVAVRRIEAGSLIGASDVEMRMESSAPTTAVRSLEMAIGKEAVRAIEADTVLQGSFTRSPMQVQRGETVKVFARTGGITVSTFAVAQQNGALGDLVQLQTLDRKDRFAARVSGWKQLEVLPTGVTTADYEALHHPETQKR